MKTWRHLVLFPLWMSAGIALCGIPATSLGSSRIVTRAQNRTIRKNFERHLTALVEADAVSDRDNCRSNTASIDHLQAGLESSGRLKVVTLHSKSYPGLSNLLVCMGPADKPGGLAFSGHTDVVPSKEAEWPRGFAPNRLNAEGGFYLGRGVTDMGGFVALMKELSGRINVRQLTKPLWFIWTHGEEIGQRGAKEIGAAKEELKDLFHTTHFPEVGIIGEPTDTATVDASTSNFRVYRANKGGAAYRIHFTGKAGHSAFPDEGINAVEEANEAGHALKLLGASYKEGPLQPELFERHPYRIINQAIVKTTNRAVNVIPADATLDISVRLLPGDRVEEISRAVHEAIKSAVIPAIKFDVELLAASPSHVIGADSQASKYVGTLFGTTPVGTPYTTDAGPLSELGIQWTIAGPGQDTEMHKNPERLRIESIDEYRALIERAIEAHGS